MRLSGQMGVPVIVAENPVGGRPEVIVGFDRPRLEQLAARAAAGTADPDGPRLGLRVKDAAGGGAEVGAVHPGTPAERAGLRSGDVIELVDGRPVASSTDLEGVGERLRAGAAVELGLRRDGQRLLVRLSA